MSLFTTFCLKSWDKFFKSKRSFYFTGAGFVGLRLRRHDGSPTGTGFQVDSTGSELARAVGSLAGECGQPSSRALRERPRLCAASATIYSEVVFLQVSENIRFIFFKLTVFARSLTRSLAFSSLVIRDLTLRSAASFGSFHLIRLLYDEYMFYLVEQKVAAAYEESPVAVIGEVSRFKNDDFFWLTSY